MNMVTSMASSCSKDYEGSDSRSYDQLVGDPCYRFSKRAKEEYFKNPFLTYLFSIAIDKAASIHSEDLKNVSMDKKLKKGRTVNLKEAIHSLKNDSAVALNSFFDRDWIETYVLWYEALLIY